GNARDLSLPESQRIDVADTPPADDPPPPADDPTPPADDPTPPDQPEPTGSVDLYLIDATTDQRVGSGPLEDGDTLSASLLSAGMFSIEADPDGAAGSVRLTWSEGGTQTEGVEPYALFGDSGGDFAGRAAQSGTQSVTVQVYAGGNANGELLAQKTVSFSFDGVSPPPQDDPGGTPAPAIDPQGLAMQADHIVFHFDGNNNDRDDIAAIPIAALLAEAGGVADKMTFLYGNNLSEPNQNSRMSELDAGGDFAKGFGIEALNYQDDVAATTARLIALLETGDEILLIEGGPMEAIYRAMDAVDPSLHANLTLLSHSTWNEDRDVTTLPGVTEARTWSDLKSDFPTATYVDIRDQNDGHNNTRGFNNSGWEWMDDSDAPLIQRARDIMEPADYAFNDPSDAGMLFYALTGVDNATPTEARALFEASGILDMPMIHLGTEGADSLTGQSEAEIFYGLQEADTIDGAGGNDYAEGGSGSDEIFGRAGDDTLRGGAAGDMVDGGGGKDRLNGGQGYDTLIGGLGNDTLRGEKGKDTLEGGDGRDVLYGGRKADLLLGGNHRDTLRGQQGDDTLEGGQYGDWLYGDQGKDILRGGSGRDQLDGGTWRDELTGGAGEDKFIFRAGYGHDTITDFEDDTDTVLLGVNLGAGLTDMTGAQIIETYAVSAGGGAPLVLDFGDDSLTFNLTYGQRSQLADDIELI
ncbi:MAG: calcium-binding protein, partial [Pseudomonadota bacterium]